MIFNIGLIFMVIGMVGSCVGYKFSSTMLISRLEVISLIVLLVGFFMIVISA